MGWTFPKTSLIVFYISLVSATVVPIIEAFSQLIGHENEYVRSSTASAIAATVEQHQQTIQQTLLSLKDYYREKVGFPVTIRNWKLPLNLLQAKVLVPEFDEYVCHRFSLIISIALITH
jgi:hypothetical protein